MIYSESFKSHFLQTSEIFKSDLGIAEILSVDLETRFQLKILNCLTYFGLIGFQK